MRLPRDVSGDDLAKRLATFGYRVTRQTGSHMRLTRRAANGTHYITIPKHKYLKVGTLSSILKDVAEHLKISKGELARRLWGDDRAGT